MKDAERKWQKDPWVSDVTEKENENGLSSTLQHWYFLSDRREKIDLIRKVVRHMKPSSALLFVNDTEKIGELLAKLRYEGVSVDALYGDTRGQERGEVMQRFRKGRTKLLIATDVAARGLDLPGLPLVIQFEPALDADHYVHRSGRTARMGREGTSITLIAPEERFIIDKLEKQLNIQVQPKMLYEGRVVSLEEGIAKKGTAVEKKPQSGGGQETKDGRPVWKSKAEYLATLKPQSASKPKEAPERKGNTPQPKKAADKAVNPVTSAPANAAKPAVAAPVPAKPAKAKAERARDKKNKGAPKWLKEKREVATKDKKE